MWSPGSDRDITGLTHTAQSWKAVTAYFTSKQLLPLDFAEQISGTVCVYSEVLTLLIFTNPGYKDIPDPDRHCYQILLCEIYVYYNEKTHFHIMGPYMAKWVIMRNTLNGAAIDLPR